MQQSSKVPDTVFFEVMRRAVDSAEASGHLNNMKQDLLQVIAMIDERQTGQH